MRDFVCVISGYAGFSSSDAWSRGFVGIFTTSLGFIRCFRKPPSISQVNFAAWRPFRSLEVISQPFRSPKAIFATKGHFRSQRPFSQPMGIFRTNGQFRRPFRNQRPFSQPRGIFTAYFTAKREFRSPFRSSFCSLEVISQGKPLFAGDSFGCEIFARA